MSDLKKLKSLLDSFGVEYTETNADDDSIIIECVEGMRKVSGYRSFLTQFQFDGSGNFIQMGAWE